MNCTKITAPLPIFVNIFYYYSTFTLILSLIITPILFYIIFTKSENLKNFKWLILNHTFWCFFFEIIFTFSKPLLLRPNLAGFFLGLLKNINVKYSIFMTFSIIFLMASMTGSLALTLLNRYLAAFPLNTINRYLLRAGISAIIFCVLLCYIADAVSFYPVLIRDENIVYEEAINYDPCLSQYFLNEPSFIFVSYESLKIYLHILFIIFITLIICGIALNIYFIFMIKSQKSQTLAKLQLSLTISATFQLSSTIIFLFIPTAIILGILCFEIPNSENIICIIFCFFVTHSVLESFVTLYFVLPYRKGIVEIAKNALSFFPESRSNVVSMINPIS